MRKTLNRVLACFLAVALLVSCCISGLVLPAAAKTTPESSVLTNLFPDDDFGDEFAALTHENRGVAVEIFLAAEKFFEEVENCCEEVHE